MTDLGRTPFTRGEGEQNTTLLPKNNIPDLLDNSDNDEEDESHTETVFTMEDGTQQGLAEILGTAGARAVTVKGTFHGRPINILVDTGCDIVCVSSRIAPRSKWKKVHGDLRVQGFNGGIVKCPVKADINWKMGNISSTWKNAWVLPAMSYDIIIGTDWMERHDPRISFKERKITVDGQSCDMENIREDLIRKCTTITAYEVEALFRKDKIVKMVVWSLTKVNDMKPTESEKNTQIETLLKEFSDVFSSELRMLPDWKAHNFRIRTVAGAKPQVRRHGRLSEREMEEMKKRIKELLAAGHIEPSSSPWSTPILFVRKKDGTLCLCIDYRALNTVTIRDEYPLSRIDAIFDRLARAKFFSTIDLNMVYHQVQLEDRSKEYTVFTCEEGHFQFKVMTFGFTNAPPTFQRMMSDYLRDITGRFVEVYLDDILAQRHGRSTYSIFDGSSNAFEKSASMSKPANAHGAKCQ